MDIENRDDLVLIKSTFHRDTRGDFKKYWSLKDMKIAGESQHFKEFYLSTSKKNVIRGMHFQTGRWAHDKLVLCIEGAVDDVVIDLRKESKTYGKVYSFKLSPGDWDALFIPKGFAHGFKSLKDNTVMLYHVTTEYAQENDTGVLFSSIGFDWGEVDFDLISERDKNLPKYEFGLTYL